MHPANSHHRDGPFTYGLIELVLLLEDARPSTAEFSRAAEFRLLTYRTPNPNEILISFENRRHRSIFTLSESALERMDIASDLHAP